MEACPPSQLRVGLPISRVAQPGLTLILLDRYGRPLGILGSCLSSKGPPICTEATLPGCPESE